MAHRIGMHRSADLDCPQCVAEQIARYLAICDQILIALDLFDDVVAFRRHMQQISDALGNEPGLLLHEHPAYTVADYLRIEPSSPAFGPIIEAATRVMVEPR